VSFGLISLKELSNTFVVFVSLLAINPEDDLATLYTVISFSFRIWSKLIPRYKAQCPPQPVREPETFCYYFLLHHIKVKLIVETLFYFLLHHTKVKSVAKKYYIFCNSKYRTLP